MYGCRHVIIQLVLVLTILIAVAGCAADSNDTDTVNMALTPTSSQVSPTRTAGADGTPAPPASATAPATDAAAAPRAPTAEPATTSMNDIPFCAAGSTSIHPDQTVRDSAEEHAAAHVDLVEVQTTLQQETLIAVLHLRDLPTELPINPPGLGKGMLQYRWGVAIDIDANPATDELFDETDGIDYELEASLWVKNPPAPPDDLPIADFTQVDVWHNVWDAESEHVVGKAVDEARLLVDEEANTLTLVGTIPGITPEARLTFEAIDAIVDVYDSVECQDTTPSTAPDAVPDTTVADAQMIQPQALNVAQQLAFLPGQGGASGTGANCDPSITQQGQPVLSVYIPTYGAPGVDQNGDESIGIAQTATFCYGGFTPGLIEERVMSPSGDIIRSVDFTFDTDGAMSTSINASDFTILPTYAPGTYTVVATTSDGEFTQTFQVTDQIVFTDTSRTLQPLSSGTGGRDITDTAYIFAAGFNPEEMLDLFFYEACEYSGLRRGVIGRTFGAAMQTQVNAEGYIFARVPDAVRATMTPNLYFNVLARGDKPPASTGHQFDMRYPFGGSQDSLRNAFDGGESFVAETFMARGDVPTCPSPATAKLTPAPSNAPTITLLQRSVYQQISQYQTNILLGFNPTNLFSVKDGVIAKGNRATRIIYEESALEEVHPYHRAFDMTFIADETQYTATAGGEFMGMSGAPVHLTGELYDTTGTRVFTAPVAWNSWLFTLTNLIDRIELPAVNVADGAVYFGGQDRRFYAFDLATEAELWSIDLEAGTSSRPIVHNGLVYVGDYAGYLFAFDAATGAERWRFAVGDWVNTPVVRGNTVYVTGEHNYLFALDAKTGIEQWRYMPKAMIVSLPVVTSDTIYIGVLESEADQTTMFIDALGLPGQSGTPLSLTKPDTTFPEEALQTTLAPAGGTFGVVVYDLARDEMVYQQNVQQSFSAASLIKVPIAVTAYRLAEQGQVSLDDTSTLTTDMIVGGTGILKDAPVGGTYTVRELVRLMLSASDNTAANMVIRHIGGIIEVNQTMTELGLTQTRLQRLLMDLDALEAGHDNLTSPADMALLFQLLARDEIAGSAEILQAMTQTTDTAKLPARLPADTQIAHKTGTLSGVEHDVGLITLPGGAQYVVVMMGSGLSGQQTAIDAMAAAAQIIYDYQWSREE